MNNKKIIDNLKKMFSNDPLQHTTKNLLEDCSNLKNAYKKLNDEINTDSIISSEQVYDLKNLLSEASYEINSDRIYKKYIKEGWDIPADKWNSEIEVNIKKDLMYFEDNNIHFDCEIKRSGVINLEYIIENVFIKHSSLIYPFGDFKVNLYITDTKTINGSATPIKNNILMGNHYHPHIGGHDEYGGRSRFFCMGEDLLNSVRENLSNIVDLVGIRDMIESTLNTYNVSSPYVQITAWKSTKECFGCGKSDLISNMTRSRVKRTCYACPDCTVMIGDEKYASLDFIESEFYKKKILIHKTVYSKTMKQRILISDALVTVNGDYIHPGWDKFVKIVENDDKTKWIEGSGPRCASKNWLKSRYNKIVLLPVSVTSDGNRRESSFMEYAGGF